ncbi:hypothetical protein ACHAXN_008606 [Cyclotella atomus]
MFVSSASFNSTETNYSAPPPPSPRKISASSWRVATDPYAVTMVTPRDPTQQTTGEQTRSSNSPHYQMTGSIQTHRRGSCSADMLQSSINEMQGNGNDIQTHQSMNEDTSMDDAHASAPHPLAAARQQQPMQFGAVQAQHPFAQMPPARPQQQHQHGNHRSYLSSMDLMTASSFNRPPHGNTNSSFGMFKSSSHHTSHTAAAGDLLSMSRNMDTPAISKEQKKRTASYGGKSYSDSMAQSAMQFKAQQHQQLNPAAMWSQPTSTTRNTATTVSAGHFNNGTTAQPTSYQQQLQNNQESYEYQNNKRRCQRADSFEMMDN